MRAEHLDTLDTMLDRIDEIEKTVRPLLDEIQVLSRKAKARVRALRRGDNAPILLHPTVEDDADKGDEAACGRKDCFC